MLWTVKDSVSKQWILIDSGAMVIVYPQLMYPDQAPDETPLLKAVNGTVIKTFGKKYINVRIGRKNYAHTAIIADISEPVLGWDIMKCHKLSLMWQEDDTLMLVDKKSNI